MKIKGLIFYLLLFSLSVFAITDSISVDFSTNPEEMGFTYKGLLYDEEYNSESIPPSPPSFQWNSTGKYLDCRWDSHENNAVFVKYLPFWINDTSDFEFTAILELNTIEAHDYFEIAIGFRNMGVTNFSRDGKEFGNDSDKHICKDIVEWGYVPANPYGNPLILPTICSDEGDDFMNNWDASTTTILQTNVKYKIHQYYDSTSRKWFCEMWQWDNNTDSWIGIHNDDVDTPVEVPSDKHFSLNAFAVNQYYDYADFFTYGTPDTKNHLEGKIYFLSYSADTNTLDVNGWQLY